MKGPRHDTLAARQFKKDMRRKTRESVAAGRLVKPSKCDRCRKRKKVEAHHADYSRPLDVLWVCRGCHVLVHREAA